MGDYTTLSKLNVEDADGTGGLQLGGTDITATASELNKLDGITATAAEMDQRVVTADITLGTAGSTYVVSPWAGDISAAYSVIMGALATASEVLTLKNNAGTTMTGGTITIAQSGSAAGDIDSSTPTANNSVTAGQKVQITTNGSNSNAVNCRLSLVIDL